MSTITLYRHALSGHSHRAELLISLLKLKANMIDVDLVNGEHKQADFLQKNIFGQVPVLEDDDHIIADSNAILIYLARRYDPSNRWAPTDPATQAEVQRFLSISAGQVAFGPAAARLVTVFGAALDADRSIFIAINLLNTLEKHLANREWLVSDHPTIADVANYTYIAHAPEGNVALDDYPNVRAWLSRIERLPGFVAMKPTAVGLAA